MENPKSPKAKAEVAFATYVAGQVTDNLHPLYGMGCYHSQHQGKKSMPCAIFFVEEAEEITPGAGVYEGGMFVYILTSADDEKASVHDERLFAIQEILGEMETVKEALNYRGGEDERPVKDFGLLGYYEAKCKDDTKARALGEALFYEVRFSKFDRR